MTSPKTRRSHRFWALSSVVLIALILRPAVAAIGPLLIEIQAFWQLTPIQASLLASLPVVCFGLGAFAAPWLSHRLGLTNSVTLILAVIALGTALRLWFGFDLMLVLSILIALAVALANVLFPTIIRAEFEHAIAKMTALYTTLLAVSASSAAFIAVPVANALGGFRESLFVWFWPSAAAVVVWLIFARSQKSVLAKAEPEQAHSDSAVYKSPITWAILLFFGLQSSNFYAVLNWLPSMLEASGYSPTQAGVWLGITTVVGVPAGLLITQNLKRFNNVSALAAAISVVTAIGILLLLAQGIWQQIGCILAGIGLASSFPLSLALIALKAKSQRQTTLLSAVSQGGGYLIAALGTFAAGALFAAYGNWSAAIVSMAIAAIVQALAGLVAGSKRQLI